MCQANPDGECGGEQHGVARRRRIEYTLKQKSERLNEIYSWWAENMRVIAASKTIVTPPTKLGPVSVLLPPIVTFEMHVETGKVFG